MRSRVRIVALLAMAGLAAGCAASNEPESYTDTVESNFMTACVDANELAGSDGLADGERYCQCLYDTFRTNVPYDVFKTLDDALRDGVNDGTYENRDDLSQVNVRLNDGTSVAYTDIVDSCLPGGEPIRVTTTTGESGDATSTTLG